MKNIFNNNSIVRMVRDDIRKKNHETKPDEQTPSAPSAHPTFYHHPSSNPSTTDTFSHTAHSTAGYSQTNTYPTLTAYNQERDKQSFLGKIESTATNLLENVLEKDTIVSATNKLNNVVTNGRHARDLLQSGAIVQLVSRSSARRLQVVMSTNGNLVFDGDGPINSFNTYFTVEEGEKGRFRFHNNCNYIAFENKHPCIISLPPGPKNNPNIDFRVHDILGSTEFIVFESCACKNCFISITSDGHLKTTNNKEKNVDAQFSVVLIANHQQPMFPYQSQPYQQFNTNPYGGFSPHNASGYMPSQAPVHHETPSAPPPPYPTLDSHTQPSTSSGLYPQFN